MERENQSTRSTENYKPILICYFDHSKFEEGQEQLSHFHESIREIAAKSGYENVVMFGAIGCESRLEIISVDKATVVEDIQKYIDMKLFEKKEEVYDPEGIQTC
jgi:hypothetical protein